MLVSRRSRYVLWTAYAGLGLWVFGMLNVRPRSFRHGDALLDVPTIANVALSAAVLVILAADVAGAASFFGRLRRARGDARQQLRWIGVPIVLFPVTLVFLLATQLISGRTDVSFQGLPVFLDYMALSICTGIAILRYRLYDIDVIVNRAVVLTGATLLASGAYIGLVVLIGGSVPGFWPSIIATAVVALAFQPVRRWLVRLADRLAFGPRAAPLEELADFNRQIADSADPERCCRRSLRPRPRSWTRRPSRSGSSSVPASCSTRGGRRWWRRSSMVRPSPCATRTTRSAPSRCARARAGPC